jgi:hypothetical protein
MPTGYKTAHEAFGNTKQDIAVGSKLKPESDNKKII